MHANASKRRKDCRLYRPSTAPLSINATRGCTVCIGMSVSSCFIPEDASKGPRTARPAKIHGKRNAGTTAHRSVKAARAPHEVTASVTKSRAGAKSFAIYKMRWGRPTNDKPRNTPMIIEAGILGSPAKGEMLHAAAVTHAARVPMRHDNFGVERAIEVDCETASHAANVREAVRCAVSQATGSTAPTNKTPVHLVINAQHNKHASPQRQAKSFFLTGLVFLLFAYILHMFQSVACIYEPLSSVSLTLSNHWYEIE